MEHIPAVNKRQNFTFQKYRVKKYYVQDLNLTYSFNWNINKMKPLTKCFEWNKTGQLIGRVVMRSRFSYIHVSSLSKCIYQ